MMKVDTKSAAKAVRELQKARGLAFRKGGHMSDKAERLVLIGTAGADSLMLWCCKTQRKIKKPGQDASVKLALVEGTVVPRDLRTAVPGWRMRDLLPLLQDSTTGLDIDEHGTLTITNGRGTFRFLNQE